MISSRPLFHCVREWFCKRVRLEARAGRRILTALLAGGLAALASVAMGQQSQTTGEDGVRQYQNMTPEQRAAATRAFLGLGPEPDRAAAARAAPFYKQNCAFCHGPQARGATGPSLITSDEVLSDDYGEHLLPFLRKGRPDKGMPAFAAMPDDELKDIAEFLHLQVEDVANRGGYRVLNILVGNAAKGQKYVATHCMSCHTTATFAHIASKFRSPEQLQRGWIWPSRAGDDRLAVTASVRTADGVTIAGRVTQASDFRIALVDSAGQMHMIERGPGVDVKMNDPLAAHQQIIGTLTNDEMHNVTAYLDTLK
jgi:cytochrome c oxidase cbb3-type subunit III